MIIHPGVILKRIVYLLDRGFAIGNQDRIVLCIGHFSGGLESCQRFDSQVDLILGKLNCIRPLIHRVRRMKIWQAIAV